MKLAIIPSDMESVAYVQAFKLEERYRWYSREIFDLMQNYNRFMEYPKVVLGFTPAIGLHQRLIGT